MRYFYTDSRIASLMQEWHDIRIVQTYFSEDEVYDDFTAPDKEGEGRWYIAEDCHEKLNPQADDIIISRGYVCQAYLKYDRNGEFVVVQPLEQLENSNPWDESYNIIQRHYKAFFMPEVDADYAGKGQLSDDLYCNTEGVIPAGYASRAYLRIEAALLAAKGRVIW